jgi:hypothetical protein
VRPRVRRTGPGSPGWTGTRRPRWQISPSNRSNPCAPISCPAGHSPTTS